MSAHVVWPQDTKLIYRHFATLFFVVLCDKSESELGILDLIQGASPVQRFAFPFLSCTAPTSVIR